MTRYEALNTKKDNTLGNWAAAELVRLLELGRSIDSVRVKNLMQIIKYQNPNHQNPNN